MTAISYPQENAARPFSPAARQIERSESLPDADRWMPWAVSISLIVAAITVRVGFFAHPFYNDSGLYAYMGKVVGEGGTLYRDFYENKPPGAAMMTSVVWRTFGSWWPGYVLTELAMTFIAAAALARAARRHAGEHARLATFLGVVVLLNFGWSAYTGFQLETIQCFFTCLAAAAAIESLGGSGETDRPAADAFTAGLAAGCAAMIKPTALAVGGAFALALVLQMRTRGWRSVVSSGVAFAAGLVVPTLTVVYWVWRTGIAGEMPNLFRQIALYGKESPMDGFTAVKLLIVTILCGYPLVVRGWVFRRDAIPAADRVRSSSSTWVFATAWLALEMIGIIAQGRLYMYHFLPLAPPLALLFGVLPRPARASVIGLCLLPAAILSVHWAGSDLSRAAQATEHKPISDYLIAHTNPGDAVFADQAGRILMETGLRPGSRFGIFYYWVNYDTAPQDYCSRMLADFDERKPKYIVLAWDADQAMANMSTGPILGLRSARRVNARRAWKQFRDYLAAHYQWEARVDDNDLYRICEPASVTARAE